jgi:citrate lyase subunit beta / citryl-CoA lyase
MDLGMGSQLHPAAVLYADGKSLPALAACEHYAGTEKLLAKAIQIQGESTDAWPVFDITADCEDGAPAGQEREHAAMVAALIAGSGNRFDRVGARIHDVRHSAWREELDILIANAGSRIAYLVLPKPESAGDAAEQIGALDDARRRHGVSREIPVHVLIETPGALHDAWRIAALPHVESLDFGLMDFVSAHQGAIPATAMRSPGQFAHPLIVRAKCEIAAAALGNGIIPSHNVTTEIRDSNAVASDARRARQEFGYLRMWSIHPNQIQPIVEAMRPDFADVLCAAEILVSAQDAAWGPIQMEGRLHDRASYRYYWQLLQRAKATGMKIPAEAHTRFFA